MGVGWGGVGLGGWEDGGVRFDPALEPEDGEGNGASTVSFYICTAN